METPCGGILQSSAYERQDIRLKSQERIDPRAALRATEKDAVKG